MRKGELEDLRRSDSFPFLQNRPIVCPSPSIIHFKESTEVGPLARSTLEKELRWKEVD